MGATPERTPVQDEFMQQSADPRPSITCPDCGLTSWHPDDVKQRYCVACHWWTSDPHLAPHRPIPADG